MAISINEIESGIGLLINGDIYLVLDYDHVKPAKGSAFVRVRLKSVKTDNVIERTFRTAEKLDDVPLEEIRMQYLYNSGDSYHFMDHTSYEEKVIPKALLGEEIKFLQENAEVICLCHKDRVLKAILPTFITAQIKETEPGIKGDSSRAGNKPAVIDTGAAIQVPLFINVDDWVKIDTRTGVYVERVQK